MAPRSIVLHIGALRGSCGYVVCVHTPLSVPHQCAVAPVTRVVWNAPFVLWAGDVRKEGKEGCGSRRGLSCRMRVSSSVSWWQQAGPVRLGQACLVSSRQPSFFYHLQPSIFFWFLVCYVTTRLANQKQLSFFLAVRRPNLFTGLSGWRTQTQISSVQFNSHLFSPPPPLFFWLCSHRYLQLYKVKYNSFPN